MRKRLAALWPQGPLAVVLAFVGVLSILDGTRYRVTDFERSRALTGLADSRSEERRVRKEC